MVGSLVSHSQFRPADRSDLIYISQWSAKAIGRSEKWADHYARILLKPPEPAASLLHSMSWMAVASKRRLFFLEASIDRQVFIITPPGLLKSYPCALLIWSRSFEHLHRILPLQPLIVNLFSPTEAERRALDKLGCQRINTENSSGDSYLCSPAAGASPSTAKNRSERDANEDGENEHQAIEP